MSKALTDRKSVRIGFIGLGIMGFPMAGNLLRAGYRLLVHDLDGERVAALTRDGAATATSPREAVTQVDAVITMLPDTPDLEAVMDGPEGLIANAPRGSLLIDMSTVDPLGTRRIGERLAANGVGFVDAPVSGGQAGAEAGTLSIMVGGSQADVHRAMPLFKVLGTSIVHVGDLGAGQVTKAANQLVVAVTIQAVAEALALAKAAGVDPARVRQALLGGFASSRILELHGQRMLDRNFEPGFRSRLHLKDARIVTRTAAALHQATPAMDTALQALEALVAEGHGELDHSALYLLVDRETSGDR